MKGILVLHGPNLNLTGIREPETYGTTTLKEVDDRLKDMGRDRGYDVRAFQSNHEGALIDLLHEARGWAAGAVFNPGALAHYSYALRDAVTAAGFPVIEVHMSHTQARETFRHVSVIAPACAGQIGGFGAHSYEMGLWGLLKLLEGSA
jgi:3-dehydroquinate dehydratase II